ncbi:MAG: stage II sporulation protein D [Paraclostridium sp.]|uniref:stage II sporulation protein D n=1 Tax=Paraclostridium sp. TaxID=2023273 RepID=UPI003F39BE0D
MKNPLVVLFGTVLTTVAIPICISMFVYDSDVKISNRLPNESNIKMKRDKKVINYETVNKDIPKIKVYNHKKGQVENRDIEEYLCGVIAGEMPVKFDLEALKAQAVAARTFTIYNQNTGKHKDADVCTDYKHCQEYKSKEDLLNKNGKKWIDQYYKKIEQAVKETQGHIVVYDDKPILPLYFATSSGNTENSEEVFSTKYPYLRSVDSPYDKSAPKYASNIKINNSDFVNTIKQSYPDINISSKDLAKQVKIKNRSEGGSVDKIKVSNKDLTGRDIRSLFHLNSANFELKFNDEYVDIVVKGYGHGVGMSQWGAAGMAEDGHLYYEILNHYYSNTKIKDIY